MEHLDARRASPETAEGKLEEMRAFGEEYRSLVRRFAGLEIGNDQRPTSEHIRKMERGLDGFVQDQESRFESTSGGMSAADLLKQSFASPEVQASIDANAQEFRLVRSSQGIFAVVMPPMRMQELRRGAQAVAANHHPNGGVSYLMLQERTDPADKEEYLRENIPHETHHIIWQPLVRSGLFESTEEGDAFKSAFQLFRDELMARSVSSGALAGYNHIARLSSDARSELEREFPGKADEVIGVIADLNGELNELDAVIRTSTQVTKIDILKVAVEAKSFVELREGITTIRELCSHFPKKEEPPAQGDDWTSVSV